MFKLAIGGCFASAYHANLNTVHSVISVVSRIKIGSFPGCYAQLTVQQLVQLWKLNTAKEKQEQEDEEEEWQKLS